MTVASTVVKNVYDGDGVTRNWPITFDIGGIVSTEVLTYVTDTAGTSTLVTVGVTVDLTVPEVVYPTVASGLPLVASGYQVVLLRQLELKQETDYKNQGTLPAETIEEGSDRTVMMVQQMQEQLDRAIVSDVSESAPDIDAITAAALAAQVAAEAAQAAAELAETHAETAETNAELAETNAETAETNAELAETNAEAAQIAAEAAQAAAEAVVASGLYDDVVSKVFANSPLVPALAEEGTLFRVDTSGGNFVVNLSTLATYAQDMKFAFVKTTADANTITLNRGGTNTIDGVTSLTISGQYVITVIVGDSATGSWISAVQSINWSAVDINGGTIDGVTIGASAAPTVTNLGTVTTCDINGGTIDAVQVGAETATGMLYVNNASDQIDGLGSQGTAGQVLVSAGTGANPTWASSITGSAGVQVFTSDGTFTAPTGITKVYLTMVAGGGGGCGANGSYGGGGGGSGSFLINYPFTVVPSSTYAAVVGAGGAGAAYGHYDPGTGGSTSFSTVSTVGGTGGGQGGATPGGGGAGGVSVKTSKFDGDKGGNNNGTSGGVGAASVFSSTVAGGLPDGTDGVSGTANTGGGGGGGGQHSSSDGGTGGSGIVIVIY